MKLDHSSLKLSDVKAEFSERFKSLESRILGEFQCPLVFVRNSDAFGKSTVTNSGLANLNFVTVSFHYQSYPATFYLCNQFVDMVRFQIRNTH